jgi:hypothetical protein
MAISSLSRSKPLRQLSIIHKRRYARVTDLAGVLSLLPPIASIWWPGLHTPAALAWCIMSSAVVIRLMRERRMA